MGAVLGFVQFAAKVLKFIGADTIKGALFEGVFDELIIEPIKDVATNAWKRHKLFDGSFDSFTKVIKDREINPDGIDGVKAKIEAIDECLKADKSIYRLVVDKITGQDKKFGRDVAKAILNGYQESLEAFDVEKFVEELSKKEIKGKKLEWDNDGFCEHTALCIFREYIKTLPKLLYSHLPRDFQFAVKIIQSELNGTESEIVEIKEMLQILLQQHATAPAIATSVERESPFTFIKRVCPHCGYDGEYLYYDKKDYVVFCSACGSVYDVVKEEAVPEQVEKLIENMTDTVLHNMTRQSDRQNEAMAEAAAAIDESIRDVARQVARHFVLQSKAIGNLIEELNGLHIDIENVGAELSSGIKDNYKAVMDIQNQIDIKSSWIVEETVSRIVAEQKEGVNNLKKDIIQAIKERDDEQGSIGREEVEEIIGRLLEEYIDKTHKKPTQRSNIVRTGKKYLCPKCLKKVAASRLERHAKECGVDESFFKEIGEGGKCDGVLEWIENRLCFINLEETQGFDCDLTGRSEQTTVKLNRSEGSPFDKTKYKYENIPPLSTLIISTIHSIKDKVNPVGGFDGFDRIVAMVTNEACAEKLTRQHFVSQSSAANIYVVSNNLIRKVTK